MSISPMTELKYDETGLIPAVIQDHETGKVLMLAYMNRESLTRSLETGQTHFWSRSRQELWHKGETSGNVQEIVGLRLDCDGDALLVTVRQKGSACHTGEHSCFFRDVEGSRTHTASFSDVIADLIHTIDARKREGMEGSYTTKLFAGGIDKILKKIGEESGEVIIAAKNHNKHEIAWEVADLLYHLLVMLREEGVDVQMVTSELARRGHRRQQ